MHQLRLRIGLSLRFRLRLLTRTAAEVGRPRLAFAASRTQ